MVKNGNKENSRANAWKIWKHRAGSMSVAERMDRGKPGKQN